MLIIARRLKIIGALNTTKNKNEKMLSFFVLLLKMITTINYNSQKISLGSLQNKKSRDGKKYQNIPILYGGRKALVHLCGRFHLEEDLFFDDSGDISHSLVIEVDADNRKLLEDFEKKLQSEVGEKVKLIQYYDRVYLKIYLRDDKGKTGPKFWGVIEKDGKEYKERIWDTESLVWEKIEGEIIFSIENIFVGKNTGNINCVAKEIFVREIMEGVEVLE